MKLTQVFIFSEVLLLSLVWREVANSSSKMKKANMDTSKRITYGYVAFLLFVPVPLDVIGFATQQFILNTISKYVLQK